MPQRVVVLDAGELDSALAVGVVPIGAAVATLDGSVPGYLSARATGIARIGSSAQPNLEAIVRLAPDLILGSRVRHRAIYDRLSRIAPTVFTETVGVTWKANLRLHAAALGRCAEAERLLGTYEARIAAFRTAMGDRLRSTRVSVVRSMPGHVRLYMRASFIGTILEDAGLPRPEPQDHARFARRAGLERIPDMDGDVVFVMYYGDAAGSPLATMMAHPLWGRLDAVRRGRVYEVPDDTWALGVGVLAAERVVEDLFRYLVAD
ncbi:MAG TPA: iron-siderophore ABC transporter substrate-binding protein [Thermodesulfobacteriota bacterium]